MQTVGIVALILGLLATAFGAVRAWLGQRDRNQRRIGGDEQRAEQKKIARNIAKAIDKESRRIGTEADAEVGSVRRKTAERDAEIASNMRIELAKPIDDVSLERLIEKARTRRGES